MLVLTISSEVTCCSSPSLRRLHDVPHHISERFVLPVHYIVPVCSFGANMSVCFRADTDTNRKQLQSRKEIQNYSFYGLRPPSGILDYCGYFRLKVREGETNTGGSLRRS
jgi:hypothetical protein